MNLKTTHSIVIGPKQVNYCSIVRKSKHSMLNTLAYYDFNFEKPDEIADIIDSISDITKRDSLFNISILHSSIIKHIYFYKKGVVNVQSNVFRDLKNDYEIQLQDYFIDYEETETEDKKIVFVVALPKKLFNSIYKHIKKHKNMKLFSLEIDIVSLKRLVNSFYNGDDVTLCIRMNANFSTIFAIKSNTVVVSRELQYGFDNFTQDISQYGGVDIEKAAAVMESIGLHEDESFSEEETKAHEIIVSSFDRMSIEIQRTIDYLLSNQKIVGIDRIVTIGEINRIKKSDVYLSKLFSIGVEKLETSKLIEFDSTVDFSLVKDMLYFDISVGAALRSLM